MKFNLPRPTPSRLAAAALLIGLSALSLPGCARGLAPQFGSTPTFSTRERFARIGRNINLESQMANDDIDHLLLLRPVTGLTEWSVP